MTTLDQKPASSASSGVSRRRVIAGLGGTFASAVWLKPGTTRARQQSAALSPPLGATYVGRTSDSDTFVAVVLLDDPAGEAVAYLCAGPELSLWFTGQISGDAITLEGPDPAATATSESRLTLTEPAPTLTGQLRPDGITGEAWLPNLTLTFAAVPAEGLAGFYVVERDEAGLVWGEASTGASLAARQVPAEAGDEDAPYLISGTVTLSDGTTLELAIPAHTAGPASMRWIVLPDGAVRGTGRRRRRASDGAGGGEEFMDKTLEL